MPSRTSDGKWRARWVDENGDQQDGGRFDRREDALFVEQTEKAKVAEIKRGLRVPGPPKKTCGDLFDYWLDKRAPMKRSEADDKSIIRKHLRPAFGSLPLRDLGVEHWDAYMAEREHLSLKTLDNHYTLLVAMLNMSLDFTVPWILRVPRFSRPKTALFSRDYRYLRTDDEIRRFLVAARAEGQGAYMLFATAVYTGMRAGELAGLQTSSIKLAERVLTVEASYDGLTKSGRTRHVPILDPLLPALREWCLKRGRGYAFVNEAGNMLTPSSRIFQEVFHRVLSRAKFEQTEKDGRTQRYIRFHDLRHTFASHWVMKGGDLFKLQKILGHQSMAMTQRYAHLAPEAFAADYSRFGTALPDGGADVVPIKRAGS